MSKLFVVLLSGVSAWGCTFYTNCPDDPGAGTAGTNPGTGGTTGSGGTTGVAGQAPTEPWIDATGDLNGLPSNCSAPSILAAKPDEDLIIAGVPQYGLWGTQDGGTTWTKLGEGEGSVGVANLPTCLAFDPVDPDIFWEAGIYGAGGIYKTRDGGNKFTQLGTLFHLDCVSVDFVDPDRKTLLTSAHEQWHTVYKSQDGGKNWEDIGPNIPEDTNACGFPAIVDADTYLLTCSRWGEALPGLYRTINGGESWTRAGDASGASSAFFAADGATYWSGETGGLLRSDDLGESWQFLPDVLTLAVRPTETPDGRLVSISKEYVLLSSDQGVSWKPVSSTLPYKPGGVIYSAYQKAFYIWPGECAMNEPIGSRTVMRYPFDYEIE